MLRKTINRAHQLKDFGTVQALEEILTDREDLGYHLFSNLEDDSLTRGMTHLYNSPNDIKRDGYVNNLNKLQ